VGFPHTALRTPLKTALNGGACSTSCFKYFPLVSIKQKADQPQRWFGHGNTTNYLTEDWNNGTKASDYDWDTKLTPNDTKNSSNQCLFQTAVKIIQLNKLEE
jgi:hypothetical protein